MKKTCFCTWFLAALVLCVLSGCVSAPIEKKFPERWEKTYVGMSLAEFKEVWPEARYNGYGTGGEQIYSYVPFQMYTMNPQMEFFVFEDDKLLRWFSQ
jgi:hypothetical protein